MSIQAQVIRGATRRSWQTSNIRAAIKEIVDSMPGASEEVLKEAFFRCLDNDRELALAVYDYAWANGLWALVRPPRVPKGRLQNSLRDTRQMVRGAIQLKCLDFILPTGKSLRDSTGSECRKAGGWLSKIAEKVGARQKVGDALSETQVRRLLA